MKHSVNTVIMDEAGKYLLQMRNSNAGICDPLKWCFFGGGLEEEESPIVGAMRETREELGIAVPEDEFNVVGKLAYGTGVVYLVRLRRAIAWPDIVVQEGAGAGFFTKEEILNINSTEQTKALIRTFL